MIYVERPPGFDHYGFVGPGEQQKYLQEILDAILHAAEKGFKPHIDGKYIRIPGWGIELHLEFNRVGSVTGFLDDTSGG